MDLNTMDSDYESPPISPTIHETREDSEIDTFPPNVSGFGDEEEGDVVLDNQSRDTQESAATQEEEEEEQPTNDDVDESKLDDAQRENAAIQIYQDFHPDREQRYVGGREIAEHEAIWSVSSFRPHWGPDKLRDNNALTYWQSDCPNPRKNHTIDLNFHQATWIRQVSVFIDYYQDESYTPKTISIRGGTTYRDLHEIMTVECDEIVGWVNADITSKNDGNAFRVFRLQIAILNTHLNGRDTHIRQLKVYSVLPSYLQEQGEKEKEHEVDHQLQQHVGLNRKPPMIHRGIR